MDILLEIRELVGINYFSFFEIIHPKENTHKRLSLEEELSLVKDGAKFTDLRGHVLLLSKLSIEQRQKDLVQEKKKLNKLIKAS